MRIICIQGSPRINGNSSHIAGRFLATAESLGAETSTFILNQLSYRGCQGCYACKTTLDRCVLEDGLTEVLDAVTRADVVVLATAIYYGDVTGQLKSFIDRTFSYLVPDYITDPVPSRLPAGKRLVFIITQGNPDGTKYADVFPRYNAFMKWYGFAESHLLRACGVGGKGMTDVGGDILVKAEELARKILD